MAIFFLQKGHLSKFWGVNTPPTPPVAPALEHAIHVLRVYSQNIKRMALGQWKFEEQETLVKLSLYDNEHVFQSFESPFTHH